MASYFWGFRVLGLGFSRLFFRVFLGSFKGPLNGCKGSIIGF